MANMRNDLANVLDISSGDDASDASSHTRFIDPEKPNVTILPVNRPIVNLIILTDSFGSYGGFIKHGIKPSSSHPDKKGFCWSCY